MTQEIRNMPFDVIPPQHTQHPLPLLPRDLWTVCAGSTDRRSRGGRSAGYYLG